MYKRLTRTLRVLLVGLERESRKRMPTPSTLTVALFHASRIPRLAGHHEECPRRNAGAGDQSASHGRPCPRAWSRPGIKV
jgi:hypothetical protein